MARLLVLRLVVGVLGRLPASWLYRLGDLVGTGLWLLRPRIRTMARMHMRLVMGPEASPAEVERAARSCVRSNTHYWADFARGAYHPAASIDELGEVHGAEHLLDAYERGCGVIVVSAHLGNPEYVSSIMPHLGIPLMIFTEPLSPPALHEYVHRVRARPGVRYVPLGLDAVREAVRHLRAGGLLAIVADRDVSGTGDLVPFFGEPARLPTGAIELARRTGAAVVPAFVVRGEGGYVATIYPPLALPRSTDRAADVRAGLPLMAQALEAGIRLAPGQWFPLQRIWPAETYERLGGAHPRTTPPAA